MSDPTDATPDGPVGDETARIPAEPEIPWVAPAAPDATDATDATRAMPWDAPTAAAAVPPVATAAAAPGTTPADDASAAPGGVLSAATVGWVAPPPEPLATGNPGWVIAGVWARLGAWVLDGFFGFVLILLGALVFGVVIGLVDPGSARLPDWVFLVVVLGFYFVYFVGFWTSKGKATPAMRLFKLQVANAADGKRLEIGPAVTRWLALGYAISIVGIIPILGAYASLATIIWSIVLLITTSQDKMHQGLHDRWAKTVVVRPEGAGSGGGVIGCLVALLVILFLLLVPIVALILLGSQVSEILSAVGESI